MSLAARHRVRPLLYASLSALHDERIPSSAMDALQVFAGNNARRNLFLIGSLLRLLDLFQANRIPAAAFKGPMLAMGAYGNAALREAGDIDILVPRRDIVRSKRLLAERGFCPIFPTANDRETAYLQSLSGQREISYLLAHTEHHLLYPRHGVNVDLHWAMAFPSFACCPIGKSRGDGSGDNRWPAEKFGDLRRKKRCLFSASTAPRIAGGGWIGIRDIRELLGKNPTMNWDRVFATAARAGAVRMVCLGLGLAEELLGARLPDQARRHLRADGALPHLVENVREGLFKNNAGQVEEAGFAKSILHLRMRERLRDRIAYCLARLEPTLGDWAAARLPAGLSWLHYILRPFRLAVRLVWKA